MARTDTSAVNRQLAHLVALALILVSGCVKAPMAGSATRAVGDDCIFDLELPPGWTVDHGEHGLTLHGTGSAGALAIPCDGSGTTDIDPRPAGEGLLGKADIELLAEGFTKELAAPQYTARGLLQFAVRSPLLNSATTPGEQDDLADLLKTKDRQVRSLRSGDPVAELSAANQRTALGRQADWARTERPGALCVAVAGHCLRTEAVPESRLVLLSMTSSNPEAARDFVRRLGDAVVDKADLAALRSLQEQVGASLEQKTIEVRDMQLELDSKGISPNRLSLREQNLAKLNEALSQMRSLAGAARDRYEDAQKAIQDNRLLPEVERVLNQTPDLNDLRATKRKELTEQYLNELEIQADSTRADLNEIQRKVTDEQKELLRLRRKLADLAAASQEERALRQRHRQISEQITRQDWEAGQAGQGSWAQRPELPEDKHLPTGIERVERRQVGTIAVLDIVAPAWDWAKPGREPAVRWTRFFFVPKGDGFLPIRLSLDLSRPQYDRDKGTILRLLDGMRPSASVLSAGSSATTRPNQPSP